MAEQHGNGTWQRKDREARKLPDEPEKTLSTTRDAKEEGFAMPYLVLIAGARSHRNWSRNRNQQYQRKECMLRQETQKTQGLRWHNLTLKKAHTQKSSHAG